MGIALYLGTQSRSRIPAAAVLRSIGSGGSSSAGANEGDMYPIDRHERYSSYRRRSHHAERTVAGSNGNSYGLMPGAGGKYYHHRRSIGHRQYHTQTGYMEIQYQSLGTTSIQTTGNITVAPYTLRHDHGCGHERHRHAEPLRHVPSATSMAEATPSAARARGMWTSTRPAASPQ